MKLDLTVNIPTILSLLVFVGTSALTGVRIYNDFDDRVKQAHYDIAALQERVRTFEATLAAVKVDHNAQIQTLRSEIRADLSEIKGTLNNILLSRKHDGR